MGKLQNEASSWTEKAEDSYHSSKLAKGAATASSYARDGYNVATNTVVLALSKAWMGIGVWRPANTDPNGRWSDQFGSPSFLNLFKKKQLAEKIESTPTGEYAERQAQFLADTGAYKEMMQKRESGEGIESRVLDEFVRSESYDKLWYMRFGGDAGSDENSYYLPLSQTYTLQAKKRLNVSSLVDGVDIIQQTRKEAKTINCSLRIALRDTQKNLHFVGKDNEIIRLADFLSELYESDAVFYVANDMINNTFGVEYAAITDYKFAPRPGMGTFTFEFSLTEVKYGDNTLTLDLKEVNEGTQQTIVE